MDSKNPIIDFQLMTKTMGSANVAKEMLALFMKELPTFKAQISKAYAQQDWETLQHHVHKLHGGLCYVHAHALKEVTAHFEKQLITQSGDYEASYHSLMKEIENVEQEYPRLF